MERHITMDPSKNSHVNFGHNCFIVQNTVNVAARCHPRGREACEKLALCSHPPCSLEWAPCNFWLLPRVKAIMKENLEH